MKASRPDARETGAAPPVVAVAASEGGAAALRRLLGRLPAEPGLALVVVVVGNSSAGGLADRLREECPLPVQEVSGDVAVEADRVYVVPAVAGLEAVDTHLKIAAPGERPRDRAPVDHLFATLAAAYGPGAIGVVLAGAGTDGAAGLARIKEAGGVAIAQDPAEAAADGVPASGAAAGVADLVLPLDDIPGALLRLAAVPPHPATSRGAREAAKEEERARQGILLEVLAHTGRDLRPYKHSLVLGRIRRRMEALHVATFAGYLGALRRQAEEARELVAGLFPVPAPFFRDAAAFEALRRRVVPELVAGKGAQDQLRAWWVGCSTGQEAYSIAMLLLEEADRRKVRPRIRVFASEPCERALAAARRGVYPAEEVEELGSERVQRFFVTDGGGWRVRPELRELVVFTAHDPLVDPPFAHLDLVVCRNLLRFLRRHAQRNLVGTFHYVLEPGGYLVLGPTEALADPDPFACEDPAAALYRRRDVPTPKPLPAWARRRFPVVGPAATDPAATAVADAATGFGAVHERMVERYAPPSLLVDAEDRVVHVSPRAGRFLELPGGEPTRDLGALVPAPLWSELRATIYAARSDGREARTRPVPVRLDSGPARVAVRVLPAAEEELEGFLLLVFEELGVAPPPSEADGKGRGERPARVRELERELGEARRQLERLALGHEAGRRRMRAANEELRSANQELQSTNQELRTALEELESTREELSVANEELAAVSEERLRRTDELRQTAGDLQNLLTSTDIATLFLDPELRIVRFTPRARELLHLRQADHGRRLTELAAHLHYPELEVHTRQVMTRLEPVEREVEGEDGGWYLARIHPYRDTEERIGGVVLTLVDITSRKRAEEALERAKEGLEERVAERTAELRELSERLRRMAGALASAEQEERRRLAALLHD
jgi:two-component system, chemotaxis family, CheB/CheR fusion protein